MAPMHVKLALSTLCENPERRTGLSTLFREFVGESRRLFPGVGWIVFAGPEEPWPDGDPGVEVCRDFPSNDRVIARIFADHFLVAAAARRRGASALITVGFHPLLTAGLPVVMHVLAVAGPRRDRGARALYRKWALARGLRRSALVVTNSSWARSTLGAGKARVLVSPEGLRHELFRPEGPSYGGTAGKYFLWASNFYPYKRVGLALAAYAGLPPRTRLDHPFVLVGGDWKGGRGLAETQAGRLGIQQNVRFLGWVDDDALPGLYRGALAHVMSTSHETFGRSVLEAMACGCPNVVQDLQVLREVAGDSALYVDFADTAAGTQALAAICADPELRARLGAGGIARSKEFSFERLARERVGAIAGILGEAIP